MLQLPALKHPDYRRLWFGAAFNQQGMSGEHVVLGALVFQITESTGWIGAIMAVYFLPLFVFGMLSGAVADWMDRRPLLRRTELAFVALQLCFAALLFLGIDD
ncbi:MAG: MFS transporter, partial [Rhodospirillaceae bacterium]|nr:MFS transporter [Rhodospirillaceae bacterium]